MHILTMVIAVYPVPLIGFVLFVLSLKHFLYGERNTNFENSRTNNVLFQQ